MRGCASCVSLCAERTSKLALIADMASTKWKEPSKVSRKEAPACLDDWMSICRLITRRDAPSFFSTQLVSLSGRRSARKKRRYPWSRREAAPEVTLPTENTGAIASDAHERPIQPSLEDPREISPSSHK